MTSLLHEALPRLLAQIVVIVCCSRLFGWLMQRLKQPMVIAEMVAGIALGPSLFRRLAPEAHAALFPAGTLGGLQLLSQVGLILFMFLIGLKLDLDLVRQRARASILISHVSIAVPFGLGILLALYLRPQVAAAQGDFLPFALFIGVALSITAFPVLARILEERKLLGTRVGALAMACAAVDDVTAWCLLAFVVATAHSGDSRSWLSAIVLTLGYVGVMLLVVRPLLQRLLGRIASEEGMTKSVVAAILVMLFLSALGTELIGVHALFGAFFFGVVLPKTSVVTKGLRARLEDLVLVVLLPLFFAYSGLRTEIGSLQTLHDWATCGLVIALACCGKLGASTLAARFSGLPWRESSALGVLMNTRGLMELVVLNIGVDIGIIETRVFTMMVIMALATTFLTTPLVSLLMRSAEAETEPSLAFGAAKQAALAPE